MKISSPSQKRSPLGSGGVPEIILPIIANLLLWVCLVSLLAFTLFSYRARFQSDAATAGMIALEQWRTGSLFVKGWYYSQDFWPMFVFNSTTLFFPLVHDAFLATQIGILFQSALIFWLTRQILIGCGSVTTANLLVAFLCSGISYVWSEFFYGQGQYGNVLMFLLLDTALMLRLLSQSQGEGKIWPWVGLFVINCYTNTTSVRYLAFFVGPAILSLGFLLCANVISKKRLCEIALLILVSTFLGLAGFSWLKHAYTFLAGADGASFASYHDVFTQNLPRVIEGFLSLIADESIGVKFASPAGLLYALKLCFGITLFSTPFYLLATRFRGAFGALTATEKYLVVYFAAMAAISLFSVLMLATTVNSTAAARYMMLAIFFGIFVSAILIERLAINNANWALFLVIAPLCLANISSLNGPLLHPSVSEKQQLVQLLKENKLERGFATYWNADVLTVLSNYQVMVAHIEGERPLPSLFMSSKEFYKPVGVSQNFLLLDDAEVPKFDFESVKKAMGQPVRTLKLGHYQIFVYDGEFAAHLPGWQ